MTDYIYKIGNFNAQMIKSGFTQEGYYDLYNMSADELKENAAVGGNRTLSGITHAGKTRWEFAFSPCIDFLASADPLIHDTELKISFDRAPATLAFLETGSVTNAINSDPLVIKDCVAVTEYISSPQLRSHFESIEYSPIVYEYEETEVLIKNIQMNEKEIRFDNLRGGNIPGYMFAAIVPQASLAGSVKESSTSFKPHNVNEVNITLNGNSVNGFPLTIKDENPTYPLQKFLDVTDRLYNVSSSGCMKSGEFYYNFLWSHKFEAEVSGTGWTGITLKLNEAYTEPMTLIIWVISSAAISVDKYHQIEKINL